MQDRGDGGYRSRDSDDHRSCGFEGGFCNEHLIAVTAVDYSGRVLTVVSRADITSRSVREPAAAPFMTILFGGPLGQRTWKADTWLESLRNHAMAVSEVIESISLVGAGGGPDINRRT
jgi:hypothetical protein